MRSGRVSSSSFTSKSAGGLGSAPVKGHVPPVTLNGKIVTPMPLRVKSMAANSTIDALAKEDSDEKKESTYEAVAEEQPSKGLSKKESEAFMPKGGRMSMLAKKDSGVLSGLGYHKKKEQETVVMTFSETETISTFAMTSFVVGTDSHAELAVVEEREKAYESLKEAHKNPDGFARNCTQTVNMSCKDKNESAIPPTLSNSGCQASSYEIDDTFNAGNKTDDQLLGAIVNEADAEDPAGLSVGVRDMVTELVNVAKVTPGSMLNPDDLTRPPGPSDGNKTKRKKNKESTSAGISDTASVATGVGSSAAVGDDALPPPVATDAPDAAVENMASEPEANGHQILFERKAKEVIASSELLKKLEMVERAVQQNAFNRKHLDFRDLPDIRPIKLLKDGARTAAASAAGGFGMPGGFGVGGGLAGGLGGAGVPSAVADEASQASLVDEDEDAPKAKIKQLFTYFNSDLVRGRSVTTMCWNKANQDILAVGYGKLDTFEDTNKPGEAVDEELAGGLVLFWSLRNPEYPEKVLRTSAPVTSLDFSKLSPMLLAVGLYNGDINVYDVKREGKEWSIPVESSTSMNMGTGHTDAVWHVKWVPRGNERVETLVTISSDGRVLQWAILKGLGVSTLMRLARSGSTDGWITRQASGLSFDFCPDDPTTYVVGTEEGSVHKCSVSYSEQYLETYQPHHGPVYRVSCSPHWPQVFLTCSADWSISLYHLNVRDKPIFSMRATEDSHFAINDICWCQDNSTVFAAVTQNGMLQIWDMSVSCLDPVVCYNTSQDDVTAEKKEEIEAPAEDELGLAGLLGRPSAGMPASGLRHEHKEEEKKETRIQRLVRNLASDGNTTSTGDTIPTSQRVLTSVRFSEAAPTVVVGDNKGTVTVYRVIDPVVQTQMGPLQQTEKLKNAVAALDPVAAELVMKVEAKAE